MRLIDKLVVKDLIGPFVNGLLMFLLLVFTAGFLFKATDLLVQGAPPLLVLKYVIFALPSIVTQTFPMAMLLAGLMGFGRLSADREAVALFAAGISFPRAIRSVLVMGVLVSIAAFLWNDWVVPPASSALNELKQQALQHIGKSSRALSYTVESKDKKSVEEFVKIDGGYDAATQTVRGVSIVKYNTGDPQRKGDFELLLQCDHAVFVDDKGLNCTYYDAHITLFAENKDTGDVEPQTQFVRELRVLPNKASIGRSFRDVMKSEDNVADRMTFRQLQAEVQADRAKGRLEDARGKEVDLYGKIALPLASLIFGVVGASLGLSTARGAGRTVGFGMAIFIVFLYWVFYHSMFVVGKNGAMSPILASFAADIVGAAIGLVLAIRASR